MDLSITKTDSPDPVVSGSSVTYTLKVTNNHAATTPTGIADVDTAIGGANGIVLTDSLPVGVTFNNFTGTHADWSCSHASGTVTCNYDGKNKHPTIIEDDVKIGSDTMMVAPVTIGRGSMSAAGSVIIEDVPEDSLVAGVPAKVKKKLK